jgi:predicted enzyme related to lactoylglutathione lyase
MKRTLGIGGIFFKARDRDSLLKWYADHLGIPVESWGGTMFSWPAQAEANPGAGTVWSIFKQESDYFLPSTQNFMINLVVDDLDALLPVLKSEGVELAGEPVSQDFGKFAWIMDPEGNKIELWQPPNQTT